MIKVPLRMQENANKIRAVQLYPFFVKQLLGFIKIFLQPGFKLLFIIIIILIYLLLVLQRL